MQTLWLGLGLVGGSVLASLVGVVLVRRIVPYAHLHENNDVAGYLIPIVGIAYAVLLAFMVITVWQRYETASANVDTEADELTTLWRLAAGFPDADRMRIQDMTKTYASVTITQDWPAMQQGKIGARSTFLTNQLWGEYTHFQPSNSKESAIFTESLTHMSAFNNARRERLHEVRGTVPNIIWIVLGIGGVMTVGFTYFFGVRSFRSQALMTAAVTVAISVSFLLVLVFNHPFRGSVPIQPNAFKQAFDVFNNPGANAASQR